MWEYNDQSGEPPDSKQQGQATGRLKINTP